MRSCWRAASRELRQLLLLEPLVMVCSLLQQLLQHFCCLWRLHGKPGT